MLSKDEVWMRAVEAHIRSREPTHHKSSHVLVDEAVTVANMIVTQFVNMIVTQFVTKFPSRDEGGPA